MVDLDIIDEDGNVVRKQFTPSERIVIATQSALLKAKNVDDVHTIWAEMVLKMADYGEHITLGDGEKVMLMIQALMIENFGQDGAIFRIENFFLDAVQKSRKAGARNVRDHKVLS
jgi:hypothetical protein